MKITLIPIRSDASLTLAMKDEMLMINGVALAQLPDDLRCWVLDADASAASVIIPYKAQSKIAPANMTLEFQGDGPVVHPDI